MLISAYLCTVFAYFMNILNYILHIYEFYYRLQNVNDDKEEIIKLYSYNIPIKYNMGSGRSFYEVIKIFDQYGYMVYTRYIDSIEDINFERIEEIFLENGWN